MYTRQDITPSFENRLRLGDIEDDTFCNLTCPHVGI
jgi:hypothetical protein